MTNLWNSLPDVVVTAPSLNIFKNRLDKHWIYQDVVPYMIGMLKFQLPEAEVIFFVKFFLTISLI